LPFKARDVKQALKSKGFEEDPKRDHLYYLLYYQGKKTGIYTKVSHGQREIPDSLFARMAGQIRLSSRQFQDFVDCGLEYEDYLNMLIRARIVRPKEQLHNDTR
jgi:hypothetical protein